MSGHCFIVGGGNLGSALARGLLARAHAEWQGVVIIERDESRREWLADEFPCPVHASFEEVSETPKAIILAVKPQDSTPALKSIAAMLRSETLVLSVMAGIPLACLSASLDEHAAIVRSMPNLPARVGRAMSVFYAPDTVDSSHRNLARTILSSIGQVLEVNSESLLDPATALSGSGPAYLYYFIEQLIAEAVSEGFPAADAELLIRETIEGALALWRTEALSVQELRAQVTSKGGTTAAAIEHFSNCRLGEILREGIHKAAERARSLSGERAG